MSSPKEDRRLFERFRAPFRGKLSNSNGDQDSEILLQNASVQGVKFTTKTRVRKHDRIAIMVSMDNGDTPLELQGQVVWTKEISEDIWDAGMKFHKVQFMKVHKLFHISKNIENL